jgi:hypothetical protein
MKKSRFTEEQEISGQVNPCGMIASRETPYWMA